MARMLYMPGVPRYSRQWWVNQLKTLGWVLLVTILVWVYADMEFTDQMEFSATIRLVAPAENITLVRERDGGPTREMEQIDYDVTFKLRGSRGSLERFRQWLNSHQSLLVYDLSESYVRNKGSYSPLVSEILTASTPMLDYGLALVGTSADTVTARMEERVQAEVPVTFLPRSAALAGDAEIRPPKVAVRASLSTWEAVLDATDNQPVLQATYDLKDVEPGTTVNVPAQIIPEIAGLPVQPSRETVDVTLKVNVRDLPERLEFKAIVRLQTPHTWATDNTWRDYQLQASEDFWWQKTVVVSGPRSEIDKLRARLKDVDAYIELRDDDKDKGFISKTVNIRIPEDLDVQLLGPRPTVQVRLVKRDSGT